MPRGDRPGARARGWIPAAVATPFLLLFLVLKAYGVHPAPSDENIYFYNAVRTAFDGLWPYRDYFFAHPPLHVFIAVAVFKVVALLHGLLHGSLAAGTAAMTSGGGWSDDGLALVIAKSIPATTTTLTGVLIYRATRRAGGAEGVVAVAVFLFALGVLKASSHFTGIAEAACFTALGIVSVLEGRDRLCGLAFAAGCLVAMYVAPLGLAVWLVLLVISRRRALTVALWTAAPLLTVHTFFWLLAGQPYWNELVVYHLTKPSDVRTFGDALGPVFHNNARLFLALPIAIVAVMLEAADRFGPPMPSRPAAPSLAAAATSKRAARRRAGRMPRQPGRSMLRAAVADLLSLARLREDPRRQLFAYALAGATASFVFFSRLNPVFDFYFVIVFVPAAMLAGYGYGALLRAGWLSVRALARGENAGRFTIPLILLLVCAATAELAGRGDDPALRDVVEQMGHVPVQHRWRAAPALGALNSLIRATLWSDEERLGERSWSVTEYLWHESEVFPAPAETAAYLRTETPPGATLFGDSYAAPLAALMAGRRLPLDEADTNLMRFMSAISPPRVFIERLEQAPPLVVLADSGLLEFPAFADWIGGKYTLVHPIDDPNYDELALYRRIAAKN